ncbi:MAG: PAS domain S-box protein [Tepidanaerobacteraceae bacterium]|nr:PAS domain S-box protein [Tepidanaerobacteraceae bacterium]
MNPYSDKKILIVEDSRLNAQITADILVKNGYKSDAARTGEEALEKIRSGLRPDLILMDIELGKGMDGIETAQRIQRIADIPVVFLTANASKEIMKKICSVTAYGYVIKNSDKYALLSAVEMALKLHEANSRVKRSEELFHRMFQAHEVVMLLIEPESGRIVEANEAACRFYGYSRDRLLEMSMEEINATFGADITKKYSEALKKSCNPCICTHRMSDGREKFVEVYSAVINHAGKTLLDLIVFDITRRVQTEKEIKLFRHLVENSLVEIYIFRCDTLKFVTVNRSARENLGYTSEELEKMTPLDITPELNRRSFLDLIASLAAGKQDQMTYCTVHRRRDGSVYPVENHLQLMEYTGEKVYMVLAIDITDRRTMEAELAKKEATLRAIMESARDAIVMVDGQGNVIFWNPAAEQLFGYSREEIMGKQLHKFIVPAQMHDAYKNSFAKHRTGSKDGYDGKTLELTAVRKDGCEIEVELSLSRVKVENEWHSVGIIRDISERKRTEEKLYQLSITDPLTGVYNRRFFMRMMEREIERARRTGRSFSIIMLDLDRFKSVNDRFGHAAGDAVLVQVTEIIKKRIRKSDCLARWGGEEFIILLPETPAEDAANLADELRRLLSGMELPEIGHVTASFGVSGFRSSDTIDTVIMRADTMLYEAKSAGRNLVRFSA